MSNLSGFDGIVLAIIVVSVALWLVLRVRKSLRAKCGCSSESCGSCSGCAKSSHPATQNSSDCGGDCKGGCGCKDK